MNNLIAVSVGDIKGIGIELYIKALKSNKISNTVLFCNEKIFKNYLKNKKKKIKYHLVNDNNKNLIDCKKKLLNIYTFKANTLEMNTYLSITEAYQECKKKNFIGLVTLPLRKDLIIKRINKNFMGHTEMLEKLNKKNTTNMILFHKQILISTITTHIKINSITKVIRKRNFLYNKILSLNDSLIKDFGIKKPKIIISGLNPHAGENGKLGKEEEQIIKPIIKKARKNNINIDGPYSADSMLLKDNFKKYDCFLFIFHDQGLIPFKFISKFSGVNFTSNLDIVRVSPDHGTAYNLLGSNKVSDKSLINCFKLIKKINKNRLKYEKSKKIIKSELYN